MYKYIFVNFDYFSRGSNYFIQVHFSRTVWLNPEIDFGVAGTEFTKICYINIIGDATKLRIRIDTLLLV